jgi:hypothetical protein
MERRYGSALGFVNPGLSWGVLRLRIATACLLLLLPGVAGAQGLPAYRPINPVAASRSGLGFEPFRQPAPGRWQVDVGVEYASTIEFDEMAGARFHLDSELLRTRATVYHDLGSRTFLLAEGELLGAYDGVLDGFLEWYHGLLGIEVPEREQRPRNDFLYATALPGRRTLVRRPGDLFLGDLRIGAGFRPHSSLQSVVSLTLPTNSGPPGYGREVVSISLLNGVRVPVTPRLVFEGGIAGGFTPASGALTDLQRELFLAGNAGLRWRFWGRQSLFGNLLAHSPYYRGTNIRALDRRELSFDFGWILAGEEGRELRVGMAEDLEPGGPAVDLVFRIGARL